MPKTVWARHKKRYTCSVFSTFEQAHADRRGHYRRQGEVYAGHHGGMRRLDAAAGRPRVHDALKSWSTRSSSTRLLRVRRCVMNSSAKLSSA
jgi:hypothetical protein